MSDRWNPDYCAWPYPDDRPDPAEYLDEPSVFNDPFDLTKIYRYEEEEA